MKEKYNQSFHVNNGQINIANDNSTVHANLTIGKDSSTEEKLLSSLHELIQTLKETNQISMDLRYDVKNKAELAVEDIQEKEMTPKRLQRFRNFIRDKMPEMQACSTVFAAISAVNDALQLYR